MLKKSMVLFALLPIISLYASDPSITYREGDRGGYRPAGDRAEGGGYRPAAGGYRGYEDEHPGAAAGAYGRGAMQGYEQGNENNNNGNNPVYVVPQQQAPENPYDSNPDAGY